jgi:hypothetical protein
MSPGYSLVILGAVVAGGEAAHYGDQASLSFLFWAASFLCALGMYFGETRSK